MHVRKLLALSVLSTIVSLSSTGQTSNDAAQIPGEPTYWSPLLVDGISLAVVNDARSAGMGGVGVTTSPDAYSIAHNMSKLAFIEQTWGLAVSHVPWMTGLVKDMNISSLVGYYSFEGQGDLQHAFSSSLRYFHIGNAQAIPKNGDPIATIHPYEFSVDLGYALRFHKYLSAGIGLRYLVSDYNYAMNGVSSKADAMLVDLSFTYVQPIRIMGNVSSVSAALAVNNVGGKMTHDGGNTYLYSPAILRIGIGATSELLQLNRLGVHFEINKLLVPTFPSADAENYDKRVEYYYAQSPFKALFSSWNDAPGGIDEELKEVNFSVGAEYTYADRLMGRIGYRYQHPSKGMGQGVTLGLGVKYEMVTLDASYFIATVPHSPLNNTLRLTVGIDM